MCRRECRPRGAGLHRRVQVLAIRPALALPGGLAAPRLEARLARLRIGLLERDEQVGERDPVLLRDAHQLAVVNQRERLGRLVEQDVARVWVGVERARVKDLEAVHAVQCLHQRGAVGRKLRRGVRHPWCDQPDRPVVKEGAQVDRARTDPEHHAVDAQLARGGRRLCKQLVEEARLLEHAPLHLLLVLVGRLPACASVVGQQPTANLGERRTVAPVHHHQPLGREALLLFPQRSGQVWVPRVVGGGEADSHARLLTEREHLVDHAAQVGRLETVVKLGGKALLHRVENREEHPVHQQEDRLDGGEVEPEVALALGVLDFDDNVGAVAQPRAVNLADGCRAEWRSIEVSEDLLDRTAELSLDNLLNPIERLRRHVLLQHL
mmetsp:Transcript_33489/g.98439  ORF Transcript_33489/g.98439 Transcript_33489/m.98439 type:complete len:380 (+) Transcript_33489:464-1603(+)